MLPPLAGKARGFGFAGFMCRAHAEKAIKLANGKVGFPCLNRMLYCYAFNYNLTHTGSRLLNECKSLLSLLSKQVVGGRPVAVDWALPKAQFVTSAAEAPGAPPLCKWKHQYPHIVTLHIPSPLDLCIHQLFQLSAAEGAAKSDAAEKGPDDSQGSSGEEEESEGEVADAAGEVTAGEAADSLADLDQERALLKSVLAELEADDGVNDGDGAEPPAQVGEAARPSPDCSC